MRSREKERTILGETGRIGKEKELREGGGVDVVLWKKVFEEVGGCISLLHGMPWNLSLCPFTQGCSKDLNWFKIYFGCLDMFFWIQHLAETEHRWHNFGNEWLHLKLLWLLDLRCSIYSIPDTIMIPELSQEGAATFTVTLWLLNLVVWGIKNWLNMKWDSPLNASGTLQRLNYGKSEFHNLVVVSREFNLSSVSSVH